MSQKYFETRATVAQGDMQNMLNGGTEYRTISANNTGYSYCGFNLHECMANKSAACKVSEIKMHVGGYCRSNASLRSDSSTSVRYSYHFYIAKNTNISGSVITVGEDYAGAADTYGIAWATMFTASKDIVGGWQAVREFEGSINNYLHFQDVYLCTRFQYVNQKAFSTKAYTSNITYGITYDSKYYANFIIDGVTHIKAYDSDTSPVYEGGTPSKQGYIFSGWKSENGTIYTGTLPTSNEVDVTYTAVFTPITYDIHYNGNGATGGSINDQTLTYDSEFSLPSTGFVKQYRVYFHFDDGTDRVVERTSSATFLGWLDENPITYNGQVYKPPDFNAAAYYNLYPDLYRAFGSYNKVQALTHYIYNGINEHRDPTSTNGANPYYFDHTSAGVDYNLKVSNLTLTSNDTLTLRAVWSNMPPIDPPVPTKDGYTFLGWFLADGVSILWNGWAPGEDNVHFYPHWEKNDTNNILINNEHPKKIYLGTTEVKEVYFGTTKVY